MLVVGGLTGKLDFKIGVDGSRRCFCLPKLRPNHNHEKLGPPRGFEHVQITVCVA